MVSCGGESELDFLDTDGPGISYLSDLCVSWAFGIRDRSSEISYLFLLGASRDRLGWVFGVTKCILPLLSTKTRVIHHTFASD